MAEAIEGIGKDGSPLSKASIGGKNNRASFVSFRDQLEEEGRTFSIQR
jgi:hypothetical protein